MNGDVLAVPPDGKSLPKWRTEPPKLNLEKSSPSGPFALASDLTAASARITTLETMLSDAIASIIQLQAEVKELAGGDEPETEGNQAGEGEADQNLDGEGEEEDDLMLDMGDGDGSETRAVEAQVMVEMEGVDEEDEVLENEAMEECEAEEEEEEIEVPEQQMESADKDEAVVEPVRLEEKEVEKEEITVQEAVQAEMEEVDETSTRQQGKDVQPEVPQQPEMDGEEEMAASQVIMEEKEQDAEAIAPAAAIGRGVEEDLPATDAVDPQSAPSGDRNQADEQPHLDISSIHDDHHEPSPPPAAAGPPPLSDDQPNPSPPPAPQREPTPPHIDNDSAPSPPSMPTPKRISRPLSPSISPPHPQVRNPSPPQLDFDQRDLSPVPQDTSSPRPLSPDPNFTAQPVASSSTSLLPSAPIRAVPTPPLEIHIAHSDLFGPLPITYNAQYTFYRCTICTEAVPDVTAHFAPSGIHGTTFASSSYLFGPLLAAMPEGDPYARLPPRLSASNPLPVHIPGIPSTSGYTCTICNFVGVTFKSIKGHVGEAHGMTAGPGAVSLPFAPCNNLQRFWNDKSARWFPSSRPAHGDAQRAGSVVRGGSASVGGTPVAVGRADGFSEASGSQAPRSQLPRWSVGPSSQIPPIVESQQSSSSQFPSQFPSSQLPTTAISMTDEARLLKQVADTTTRNEALSKRVETIMQHNARLRGEKEAMRVKQLETQKKLEEVEKKLRETEKELEEERKISADIAAAAKFAEEQEEDEDELDGDEDEVAKEGDARGGKRKRVDPSALRGGVAAKVKAEPGSRSGSVRPAPRTSAAPPTPRSTTASGSGADRGLSQARAMSRVSQSATPRANSKRPLSPSVSPVRQMGQRSAPTPSPSPSPISTSAFIAAALAPSKPSIPTWSTSSPVPTMSARQFNSYLRQSHGF